MVQQLQSIRHPSVVGFAEMDHDLLRVGDIDSSPTPCIAKDKVVGNGNVFAGGGIVVVIFRLDDGGRRCQSGC